MRGSAILRRFIDKKLFLNTHTLAMRMKHVFHTYILMRKYRNRPQQQTGAIISPIMTFNCAGEPKPDDENDTQNMICRHLRQHYRCKECSPHSLCNHKRLKSQCHDCEFTFDELSKSRRPQRRKRAKRAPSMTTPVLETIEAPCGSYALVG